MTNRRSPRRWRSEQHTSCLHDAVPILEAMACGTAVLTSNISSLPEVAGDAAMLVDPHDESALAEALEIGTAHVLPPRRCSDLGGDGLRDGRAYEQHLFVAGSSRRRGHAGRPP